MKHITSTTEYLDCLDLIAVLIQNNRKTEQEKVSLFQLQRAVRKFELKSLENYPAKLLLSQSFGTKKWHLN